MDYEYYYNRLPGQKPWRNNLIYTSLISSDRKTFVQWYYNDERYHIGENQVVDPSLMGEKWDREVKYLTLMSSSYPELVPQILEIDQSDRKIYLRIDGNDFWQKSYDIDGSFYDVVPDWDEQILDIVRAHRSLGLYKYSMHPSSYFVLDGKLKSINYFFTYHESESNISIHDVESHIYSTRQEEMKKHIARLNIDWYSPQSFELLNELCWESFRTNYLEDFIEKVKCIK